MAKNVFDFFVPGFTSHFINQEINPFSYVEINGLNQLLLIISSGKVYDRDTM